MTKFFKSTVILVGILSVVLGGVCTGCAGEPNVQEEVTGGASGNIVAQVAMTTEALLGLGSSFPALGVAKKSPKKDEKKDEDEEEEEGKDYWKGVEFTRENFEEVQNFVRVNYIDPGTSEDRAFGEACNYALLGLNQPHTLLPTQFYKARKGHKDEEGALDGKAKRFGKRNKLTLLRLKDLSEEEEEEPRKRLTDDEIREARENYKTRQTLLEKTWKSISFTSADLETCIALGMKLGKKDKEQNHEELNRDLWLWSSQGFLRSLDPHSAVVSAKAWEESTQKTTDSSFDGIGAILTQRDGQTMIENPIEGQPAYGAGLRSGDVIVKVDGKSIKGQPLGKVVQQIRGPKNTEVVLTVRREGEPSDLQIPIVRAYIEIQNVQSRMVKDHPGIGYVKLSGFVPTSAARLRKAVEALSSQTLRGSLRGLILDLRSNSGGLLQQAVEIGDMFVRKGDIVSVRDRLRGGLGDKVYEAHSKGTYDIPLVVLVNDSSASASEIVAGAVQDNMRGLIVGERTFGKASVQTLFNSHLGPKDYYIKLTVARYYAPSGRTIQVVGIQPDLEVVPVIGKPMPLGFREENLGKHLAAIETEYQSSNVELIKPLEACVAKRGKAEKMHSADPNPQIRFDYQLMKGADYLECLADTPVPKQSL